MSPNAQPPPDEGAGGGHSDLSGAAGIGNHNTPRPFPTRGPSRRRYSFRVSWRREGWSESTHGATRIFETEHAMRRFLGKLLGDDRPDLAPLAFVNVDRRHVGPWEPYTDLEAVERES